MSTISLPTISQSYTNVRTQSPQSRQKEEVSSRSSSASNGGNTASVQDSKDINDTLDSPKHLTNINATISGDSVGEFQLLSDTGQSIAKSRNTFSLEVEDGIASVTVDNGNKQNDFKILINLSRFAKLAPGAKLKASAYAVGPSQYGGENYAPKVTVTKTNNGQIHIEADYSSEQIDNILSQLKTLNGNHNITGAANPSQQHVDNALERLRSGNANTNDINLVETLFQRLNEGYQTRSTDVSSKLLIFASSFLEGVNDSLTTHAFTHDADASSSAIQNSILKGTDVLQGQANRVRSSAESLIDTLAKARKIDLPIDKILNQINEGFRSIDRNVPPLKIGENPTDAEVDKAIEQVIKLIGQKQEAFFKDANQEVSSAYAQLSGQLSSEWTDKLVNGLNTTLNVASGISGLAGLTKSMVSSVRSLSKARSAFRAAQTSKIEANVIQAQLTNKIRFHDTQINKTQRELRKLDALSHTPTRHMRKSQLSDRLNTLDASRSNLQAQRNDHREVFEEAIATLKKQTSTLKHEKALQQFDRVNTPIGTVSATGGTISVLYNRYRLGPDAEEQVPLVPQLSPTQSGVEEMKFYKTVADNAYNLVSQQVNGDQVYDKQVYTEYSRRNGSSYWSYYHNAPGAYLNKKVNELKTIATGLNDYEKRNDPDSNKRWVVVSNRIGATIGNSYNVTFIMKVDKSQLPPASSDGEPRLLIGNNTTVMNEFGTRSYDDLSEAEKGRIKNSWSSTDYTKQVKETIISVPSLPDDIPLTGWPVMF